MKKTRPSNIDSLRAQYPVFCYEGAEWKVGGKDVIFSSRFTVDPELKFVSRLVFRDADLHRVLQLPKDLMANLAFHLGMMEIPSYWKATCSPVIEVRAGALNAQQRRWWTIFLLNGMGEYFYKNRIDVTEKSFLTLRSSGSPIVRIKKSISLKTRTLVPIGGGKDSIVTWELLKRAGEEIRPLVLNIQRNQRVVLGAMHVENPITIERHLDPLLLTLNRQGFLNGHTPFSAMIAMMSVTAGVLYDFRWIAVSNERSANESTLRWKALEINHQYSKALTFEKNFQVYVHKYLISGIEYFSALRPLYEVQIVRLFSEMPEYFSSFTSCNRAFATASGTKTPTEQWCGACPKCLFIWIALTPFVHRSVLHRIFGKDLFEDAALWPTLQELVGLTASKPFECVGTRKENIAVMDLALAKERFALPFLLKKYYSHRSQLSAGRSQRLLNEWSSNHAIPKRFVSAIKTAVAKPNPLHELRGKRVVILGLGAEGQELYSTTRRHFPTSHITISERSRLTDFPVELQKKLKNDRALTLSFGPSYLKSLPEAEVILKSPGIPPSELRPFLRSHHIVTSRTDLFFRHCPGLIIGITGTKGKSTTASLLFHVLKAAGLPVHLSGNIGRPIFEELEAATANDIFIYECSSYQLMDVTVNPKIAILLNLYPEHLSYHGNFENYRDAKRRLVQFQGRRDLVVYNNQDPQLAHMVRGLPSQRVLFDPHRKYGLKSLPFIAAIDPVVKTAELFGIPRKKILDAIRTFRPLPHRLERVGTMNGVTFINDSLSTVPEAAVAALDKLGPAVKTLIAGGYDRGIGYEKLADAILRHPVQTLILFPTTGQRIWEEIVRLQRKETALKLPKVVNVDCMDAAVAAAFRHTPKGSICLLSPASSSFNLFKDYQDRGDQFKSEVLKRKI